MQFRAKATNAVAKPDHHLSSLPRVIVESTTELPQDTDADTVVIGVLDGEKIHHDIDGILNGLVAAGEAKAKHRHLAVTHAGGKRWVLVGLGKRDELDPEKVRVAAASALGRARELGAKRLCWEVPHKVGTEIAAAIVEGTLLTGYRFDALQEQAARGEQRRARRARRQRPRRPLRRRRRGGDRRARRQRRAHPAEHARQRR